MYGTKRLWWTERDPMKLRTKSYDGLFRYMISQGPCLPWNHGGDTSETPRADPKMPVMILPDTIWSFQVLNRVLYLWQSEAPKKVLGSTFFLRVCVLGELSLSWGLELCFRFELSWVYCLSNILLQAEYSYIATGEKYCLNLSLSVITALNIKRSCKNVMWGNI